MKSKNFMKKVSLTIIALATVMIANGVSASTGPVDFNKAGINRDMKALYGSYEGNDKYFVTKDDWTTQRLYMSFARTTITNPCPNCTYVIKPYEETTKWRVGTAIQMGMHKDIPESQMPGKYALYAQRAEVTLVDSVIQGTWWID